MAAECARPRAQQTRHCHTLKMSKPLRCQVAASEDGRTPKTKMPHHLFSLFDGRDGGQFLPAMRSNKIFLLISFAFGLLTSFGSAEPMVVNLAGTGTKGFSGDGAAATNAQLNFPTGIARGPDGMYFCDTSNHRIRKINPDGTITTV